MVSARPLEVVAAHWERIQLFVRLRTPDGGHAPDGQLVLRRRDGRGRPLRSRPVPPPEDPAERMARFNVFVGHDQMPLEPGRYELVLIEDGTRGDGWIATSAAAFDPAVLERGFPWHDVTYRVTPDASAGGPFGVTISVSGVATSGLIASARAVPGIVRHRLFGLLVSALTRLPGPRRSVVFTSDSRTELGGNLKLVHDRMLERGIDGARPIRTIFKASIRARRGIVDRLRLVWLTARAGAILLEDYQPAIYRLPRRPDRRIIQLWHAWGAFKTVGYSRIGKPGGPNPWSRVHKNYTYAAVSSRHEVPFYAEAFGIDDDRAIPTGTPRMDDFLDPEKQAKRRERALELVPAARGREVILFAPTFRGRSARDADYPVDIVDVQALHELCEERDAVVLVRLHPFVPRRVAIPRPLSNRVIEASDLEIDTNDLLLVTDLLITDYSSLVFEFSALGRPMLFFAYDLDEYVATRDFYEPYETFVPGRIVRTFAELVDAIRRRQLDVEKIEPFARRHLPDEPGSATDRIIDELILGPGR